MSGTMERIENASQAGCLCPAWLAGFLDLRLRARLHDPDAILGPYVRPGRTVVDLGCGPGFFSVALARLVGPGGSVVAVDLQPRMLARARRNAVAAGTAERILFRRCGPDDLGVTGPVDFVLAFWMLHEVPDPARLLRQVRAVLDPAGRFLLVEPKLHVRAARFRAALAATEAAGFVQLEEPPVALSRAALFSCGPLDRVP
ncbi:MAG: methyltransferase domain-containing protein [Deltaproteobacteria bacterium]|nr:methyltransferase domain-containing protein [Deltaproteobacteria bacterium]